MTVLPFLPRPAEAIVLSEQERQRVAKYRMEMASLREKINILERAYNDILSTAIERAGGDSKREWLMSADLAFVFPKGGGENGNTAHSNSA
jgi:hypothetical protein